MVGSNVMDELQSNEDQSNDWSVSEVWDQWRTNGEVKYGAFVLAYIHANKLIRGSHPGTKYGSIREYQEIELSRIIWKYPDQVQ